MRSKLIQMYITHMKLLPIDLSRINPRFHQRLMDNMDRVKDFTLKDYTLHAAPWYTRAVYHHFSQRVE